MSARPTYPAPLVAECRRMKDGGWTAHAIHKILVDRMGDGAPSASTVHYWTDERAYRKHCARASSRSDRRSAQDGAYTLRGRSREYREEFVRRLAAEGVPAKHIAATSRLVLAEPFTLRQVEYLVSGRRGRDTDPESTVRRARKAAIA